MKNEHFLELFDEADDCIFISEISNGQIIRFIEVNDMACKLLGYEREELLQLQPEQLCTEFDEGSSSLLEGFLHDKRITIQTSFRTKNGELITVEANNRIIETNGKSYILTIARDITERVQIEHRLFETEHHYQLLLNHINEIFWIRSLDFSICQYVSPAFEEITGYPKEFIYRDPKWFLSIIHPNDRQKAMECLTADNTNAFIKEYRIIRSDGEVRCLRERGFAISEDGSDGDSYIGITEDITEQKLHDVLQKKSETLAAIGQLSIGLAHEIRNPLTAVKGFLQLLGEEYAENEKHRHFHRIISDELNRVEKILNDYLVLAQPNTSQHQYHPIMDMFNAVLHQLSPVAQKNGVLFSIKSSVANPVIMFEWDSLKQVFINIIQNSIEAMPNGGAITISIDGTAESLQIKIIDTGEGIAPERILKLGEPYYSTKEKGTGLGLMISYKIIENHHGTIHVDSRLHKGTTVTISLPISQPDHALV